MRRVFYINYDTPGIYCVLIIVFRTVEFGFFSVKNLNLELAENNFFFY